MSFLSQPVTLQSVFGKNRMIDTIQVQCILTEATNDTLTITKQPIQQGASITDHAYKEPTVLSMAIHQQETDLFGGSVVNTFSGNGLSKIYQQFLTLQSSLTPFTVITPKRIYDSMLMSTLSVTTDKTTENILAINVSFQQIIIVLVTTALVPRARQKNAGATGATQSAGKKSPSAALGGAQAAGIPTNGFSQ